MKMNLMRGRPNSERKGTFKVDPVERHSLGGLVNRSALKKSKIFVPVNVTR